MENEQREGAAEGYQPFVAPQGQPYAQPAPQGYAAGAQAGAVQGQPSYYQPVYAPQQQPKKSRWWIGLIIALVVLALIAGCVASCTASIAAIGGASAFELSAAEPDSVAVIEISGTIDYDGSACSPEGLKELLDEAEDDDNIRAVVLRIDSGGGTATAGEEMAEYVKRFSKPVVVSSASINASAAYEISSQADWIFVARTTEIGAIGTNLSMMDLSGLYEKLGISFESISSSPEKDSSYGRRELTDEEREMYQQLVDDINDAFIDNVVDGRGMDEAAVRELANGMPYAGTTAVENGLADEIGTLDDACAKAAELAGIEGDYETYDLSLYEPYNYGGLFDLLYDYEGKAGARELAAALLEELNAHDAIAR